MTKKIETEKEGRHYSSTIVYINYNHAYDNAIERGGGSSSSSRSSVVVELVSSSSSSGGSISHCQEVVANCNGKYYASSFIIFFIKYPSSAE